MALTAPNREKDWSAPATRGDLFRVEGNLEGKIKDLRVEMADMDRRLSGEIADMDRRLSGEIASLKVFVVWMVVGVITVLGGLVTVFEFVS